MKAAPRLEEITGAMRSSDVMWAPNKFRVRQETKEPADLVTSLGTVHKRVVKNCTMASTEQLQSKDSEWVFNPRISTLNTKPCVLCGKSACYCIGIAWQLNSPMTSVLVSDCLFRRSTTWIKDSSPYLNDHMKNRNIVTPFTWQIV